ncbi:DUF3168 domain-containing protein [Aureibacillus halotolerans]|uniref:Uncharacterized protein DUF3168 n=1 Tax=Aureibacillus halotolerans TaxID=1508390 RepID=A0A4R6U0P0_9BACI|nr:DUF3168 domain-containing protein [Aureibacillus halotolerans]TDQ39236.1 uncharacterized protein DUF3168 [Aureibacillus halotolerans]
MINKKTEMSKALRANEVLFNLVDGRIFAASELHDYPSVTYFEVTNFDSQYSEDAPYASDITMQVDVWSEGSTTDIAVQVDKTMKQLGFFRSSASDLYEEDTRIYHKAMRYKIREAF